MMNCLYRGCKADKDEVKAGVKVEFKVDDDQVLQRGMVCVNHKHLVMYNLLGVSLSKDGFVPIPAKEIE